MDSSTVAQPGFKSKTRGVRCARSIYDSDI